MFLFFLLLSTISLEWGEVFHDFIESPWLSSSYDTSISAFLHTVSGAAYERKSSRKKQCLAPLEIYTTSTKILGDVVEANIGYYKGGRGTIVLFFPGTRDEVQLFHEWLKSNDVQFMDIPKARVLAYFNEAVDRMWSDISRNFQRYHKACPKCAIYFTGHSLGGSLALLALARMLYSGSLTKDSDVNYYSFGGPRVGNRVFANWLEGFGLPIFRVVHSTDVVAHLPCCQQGLLFDCVDKPGSFSPWHVQTEIFYNDAFTTWRTCSGHPKGEDSRCANQYLAGSLSVDKHKHYFGVHTADICDVILADSQSQKQPPNSTSNFKLRVFTWPKLC